jgi:hypothetical protein
MFKCLFSYKENDSYDMENLIDEFITFFIAGNFFHQ